MRSVSLHGLSILVVSLALGGCEQAPKPSPAAPASTTAGEPPPPPPAPKGPPQLAVTPNEVKVGFEVVLMDKRDSPERLKKALAEHPKAFAEQTASIEVDRKAPLPWLQSLLAELTAAGATGFLIKTDSRPEFPKELPLEPAGSVREPAACTVTTMVLADRGTAVWKIAGGTATKNTKGFAGPDLSSTAGTLERFAKACPDSTRLYFSGAEGIEWGLLYDLAASAAALEKVSFKQFVLLPKIPVAGRKVDTTP